jgi:hypothetical protein
MQAIITKQLGPTNAKGARVRATWERFDSSVSVTVGYDHAVSERNNHAFAAMSLVRKYANGGNNWHCGELPNNAGYCFIMAGAEFSPYFGYAK